jgi:para-aminobenzoate synthetase component 1
MDPRVIECSTHQTPLGLMCQPGLGDTRGTVFLTIPGQDCYTPRYSIVATNPFMTFSSRGSRCEIERGTDKEVLEGNPWVILSQLTAPLAVPLNKAFPFPLGGCFGFWGYELKRFTEPGLRHRNHPAAHAIAPDCLVFFMDSLVVFDLEKPRAWIVSTGLGEDEARRRSRADVQVAGWRERLQRPLNVPALPPTKTFGPGPLDSSFTADTFLAAVAQAQAYIRAGDIYQVNLSQRLTVPLAQTGWEFFRRLASISRAPYSAFIHGGAFQIASASPELFLQAEGRTLRTRPIKGTRPRSTNPEQDAAWETELRTNPKENAELVMITDLLRNDTGKVCNYGSVQVRELAKLEKFAHVQHLVSTVEGELRDGITHLRALESCFPGGSITGAPKCRAMEIIDELEPVSRGVYTGALGYIGFNEQTQLSMIIRTALCAEGFASFHTGAGIVADSIPAAEYDETLHKARGFLEALGIAREEFQDLLQQGQSR